MLAARVHTGAAMKPTKPTRGDRHDRDQEGQPSEGGGERPWRRITSPVAKSQRKIPTRKGKKKSLDAAESVWMATGGRSSAASPMTNCMVAPITSAAARMMAPAKAVADAGDPRRASAAREAARNVRRTRRAGSRPER